jgi:hypothetical protein
VVQGRVISEDEAIAEAVRLSLQLQGQGQPAQTHAAEPAPSEDSRVEARLRKLAEGFAGHPTSLDTILAVLKMILENPTDTKYRRLRLSNRRFAATVVGAPSGIDFLLQLGFARDMSQGVEALLHTRGDLGLLWLGKSVLEVQQQTAAYERAKAALDQQEKAAQEEKSFRDAMAASQTTASAEEEARRDAFRRRVPSEPLLTGQATPTGASRIKLLMGEHKVVRRFASDDTLADVVTFIGSLNSAAPEMFATGAWALWDFTVHPPKQLACTGADAPKTLYGLELWPAATLSVTPADFDVNSYYKKLGWGYQ